jgi:hypothetical protein
MKPIAEPTYTALETLSRSPNPQNFLQCCCWPRVFEEVKSSSARHSKSSMAVRITVASIENT